MNNFFNGKHMLLGVAFKNYLVRITRCNNVVRFRDSSQLPLLLKVCFLGYRGYVNHGAFSGQHIKRC